VANLGLPAAARPRYHETGVGGSIHTDSPIMPQVADVVGLLCLSAAMKGGDSKFVSVARVHDILLQHAESLLSELYEPFYFDRRISPSAVSSANPALLRAPIFTYDPDLGARGLRLRWQPEYVWGAPDLPGAPPLSERRRLALHLLEGVLEDRAEAITVRLSMQPGDMQFLNNHAVAHGRTPFLDPPQAEASPGPNPPTQREMRRTWLRRRP
jgi:alpha-ketoglutarate-dependent taurine dioxygenase